MKRKIIQPRVHSVLNLQKKSPRQTTATAIIRKLEEIKAEQLRQSDLGNLALFQKAHRS